jgi:hypothetical protein
MTAKKKKLLRSSVGIAAGFITAIHQVGLVSSIPLADELPDQNP